MEIEISSTPESDAGKYISSKLKENNGQKLVLLSGGSAFSVLDYIDLTFIGTNTVFMMADDRFTKDPEGNNYTQLKNHSVYNEFLSRGASFFSTEPMGEVTHEEYAETTEITLKRYLAAHESPYVLVLLGIGEDGHTASIFPDKRGVFESIYYNDKLYIPVTHENDKFPKRITITPYFINTKVTDVVLFALAKNKCDFILKELLREQAEDNEIPALIPARHSSSHLFTDCMDLSR